MFVDRGTNGSSDWRQNNLMLIEASLKLGIVQVGLPVVGILPARCLTWMGSPTSRLLLSKKNYVPHPSSCPWTT